MSHPTFFGFATLVVAGQLDAHFVREALLRKQFLPFVKAEGEELPDIFDSETFSDDAAAALATEARKKRRTTQWVELRTRRFDGLIRRLGVPHPLTYANLVDHICTHWAEIEPFVNGSHSQIKPTRYEDGRIIQMSYEEPIDAIGRHTRNAQGKYFVVKADISSCFSSIYSHAIDWATRGKQVAKASRKNSTWQVQLDTLVRNIHDGETKGLMIGPAVSNLLSEIILQRVDENLAGEGFTFTRYVDDFTAYCKDRTEAENFIVALHRSLGEFRLDINNRKTQIVDLAPGDHEEWLHEIIAAMPGNLTPANCSRYLRRCEFLASRHPQQSVLKFAVKVLLSHHRDLETPVHPLEVDEMVRICEFHPHLIPFLADMLQDVTDTLSPPEVDAMAESLTAQMVKASKKYETDLVCWYLHVLREVLNCPVSSNARDELVEMGDDLALLALAALCPEHQSEVADCVRSWIYSCDTDYEEHWLIRYELRRIGLLAPHDLDQSEKEWMDILKNHGVKFSRLSRVP